MNFFVRGGVKLLLLTDLFAQWEWGSEWRIKQLEINDGLRNCANKIWTQK